MESEHNDTFYKPCICNLCDMIRQTTWVSVKDRLPDREQRVLCYHGYVDIKVFDKQGDSYIFYDGDTHCYCPIGVVEEVTHWMTLPKPPKD